MNLNPTDAYDLYQYLIATADELIADAAQYATPLDEYPLAANINADALESACFINSPCPLADDINIIFCALETIISIRTNSPIAAICSNY